MWADVGCWVLGWVSAAVVVFAVACRGFYRLDEDGEPR